jgi:hypothetical protein
MIDMFSCIGKHRYNKQGGKSRKTETMRVSQQRHMSQYHMASARCRASSQSRGSSGLILRTSLQRAAALV